KMPAGDGGLGTPGGGTGTGASPDPKRAPYKTSADRTTQAIAARNDVACGYPSPLSGDLVHPAVPPGPDADHPTPIEAALVESGEPGVRSWTDPSAATGDASELVPKALDNARQQLADLGLYYDFQLVDDATPPAGALRAELRWTRAFGGED